jgi:hypothetical protein
LQISRKRSPAKETIMIHLFRQRTSLLAAFAILGLAGCQEDFSLLDDSGKVVGKGVLEITANFPSPAHLLMGGKEYAGSWSAQKIYERSLAKVRHHLSDRAYVAYEIGNDPAQLKHGHANLTAGDGSKIQCDFYYRGQPAKGSCDMDGKRLQLTVQRLSSMGDGTSQG